MLVAGTVSKTYAMTGWRIGFGLVPENIVGAMMKLQSHSTSNPTSISQKAAVEALRGPQDSVGMMLARISQAPRFRGRPPTPNPRRAVRHARWRFLRLSQHQRAFWAAAGSTTPQQFAEKLLAEAHVAVVPGEAFGTEHHVRISYATSMENLERGLDRMHRFIDALA